MDIKEIINKRYAMPDASLHKLQRCLTEVSYPKGFQVLKRGKVDGCASAQLKEKLLSLGAVAAMLSGSGAGVFGIFDSVKAAKAAAVA